MQFAAPNAVCRYRADTFSSKEPETLDWIDEFGHLGALYDIGANVGLYSVYFAKSQTGTVYAFEPSALNLNLLVRNINANGVQDRVVVVANPLTASNSIASFNLSSDEAGGAMSTFGETYGHDGKPLDLKLSYVTVGLSLDSLWAQGLLAESPALIKIDVDGIEHLVLAGAHEVLGLESLKSILIEVNEEFTELKSGVASQLSAAGFQMRGKFHGDLTAGGQYSASFNQIWTR
jgi:FkbM family methyltransferase